MVYPFSPPTSWKSGQLSRASSQADDLSLLSELGFPHKNDIINNPSFDIRHLAFRESRSFGPRLRPPGATVLRSTPSWNQIGSIKYSTSEYEVRRLEPHSVIILWARPRLAVTSIDQGLRSIPSRIGHQPHLTQALKPHLWLWPLH